MDNLIFFNKMKKYNKINSKQIIEYFYNNKFISETNNIYNNIFKITNNLQILKNKSKITNSDNYIINLNFFQNFTLRIKKSSVLFFKNIIDDIFLLRGKAFANTCLIEDSLKLNINKENFGIIFSNPGIYYITSKNLCIHSKLLTIFVS